MDSLRGELEPPLEKRVVGEQLLQPCVDRRDVLFGPGERDPAEWPDAAAEERPDIGRDEARVCERVRYPGLIGLPSKVVAIIENIAAGSDELEQALDVPGDRLAGTAEVRVGIARAELGGGPDREPRRDVALERIVRRRLVCDEVEVLPACGQLGHDLRCVAEQPDGQATSFSGGVAN